MKFSRRKIVIIMAGLVPAGIALKTVQSQSRQPPTVDIIFSAMVDAFVPADEYPGAINLGVNTKLLAHVKKNKDYLQKVTSAMANLQQIAQLNQAQDFDLLSLDQRVNIITRMMKSKNTSQNTRIQLSSMRAKTITEFYRSDEAFKMLAYHPPAYGGYPDYHIAPKN